MEHIRIELVRDSLNGLMSGRPLRLLILEDSADDSALALDELRRAGFDPTWHRVDDEAGFKAHLDPELDLVLADYHQPQFDALRALKLVQEASLDIPVVIVSGAIGEDRAVAAVRLGAMDYGGIENPDCPGWVAKNLPATLKSLKPRGVTSIR